MLCNLQVFATSELSSNETKIHQCTDDNTSKGLMESTGLTFETLADKDLYYRSGNSPPAASKPTTLATPATSTLSPSPLTDRFVPLEARTALLCSGI